jgi:hypothetical protein
MSGRNFDSKNDELDERNYLSLDEDNYGDDDEGNITFK